MKSIPRHCELQYLFNDSEKVIEFLLDLGVFIKPNFCIACGRSLSRYGKTWKCTKRNCRKTYSVFSNSFFAKSKLKPNKLLELGYMWLIGSSHTSIMHFTNHSCTTITAYFAYFRQLCTTALNDEDTMIGGDGIEVEIDESKFGKRRYNRGHRVEGAWVFGGIERTVERKYFIQVVPDRTAATLIAVIERHILPGSIVLSDCWRAYHSISAVLPVEHHTVNHSVGFVDEITGVHTNSIEAKWGALKRKISIRGRVNTKLDSFLFEQIWRDRYKGRLWEAFLDALNDVHYD